MHTSPSIPEADWKVLHELRSVALDRFCQRVLDAVARLAAESGQTNHQRYRAVFELLKRRDRELADAFDDPRRSQAILQLARIVSHDLLTEEEVARFSPETRQKVEYLLQLD